ncbi:helix-turn-helix domain-containing protein [Sphingomonas sp. S2-65]|uniref:helix-turn-helix domain-containing protein n=1 Tax=Sphingomonas sp. S2-65 TaxID=2903960 RepID=UPI001F48B9FD|nr:helix-turn-helix transcriptional regulator [Sphingomonas sp. S2-65]UYY57238.1 helix-turn-helix transcriptional regulator [Sphingomonas sp. S2-65]
MFQTPARRWSADHASCMNVKPEEVAQRAASPFAAVPRSDILSLLELLSSREHEIAVLVARGLSNKEVALNLRISPWTVSAHLRRIFTKLDIRRRIELCILLAQFR